MIGLAAGIMLVISAPASLAACPATDPLCVTDDVLPPEDPLPPVDDVKKAVGDAVDSAKRETDKVVGQVTDTVDGLLDPGGGGPVDDPGGDGDGGGGGGENRSPRPSGRPGLSEAGGTGTDGISTGTSFPGGSVRAPASVPSAPRAFRDQPGIIGRIGGAAAEVARQLGFPLALALIVVAFGAIQNYLDRRDPKLALAPVRPEVLRFE
jgi:hypothetical protein